MVKTLLIILSIMISTSAFSFESGDQVLAKCGGDRYLAIVDDVTSSGLLHVQYYGPGADQVCGDRLKAAIFLKKYNAVEEYTTLWGHGTTFHIGDVVFAKCGGGYRKAEIVDIVDSGLIRVTYGNLTRNATCLGYAYRPARKFKMIQ